MPSDARQLEIALVDRPWLERATMRCLAYMESTITYSLRALELVEVDKYVGTFLNSSFKALHSPSTLCSNFARTILCTILFVRTYVPDLGPVY